MIHIPTNTDVLALLKAYVSLLIDIHNQVPLLMVIKSSCFYSPFYLMLEHNLSGRIG